METRRAMIVTDAEESSFESLLRYLGFSVIVPRRPSIELVIRHIPDLVVLDWSPRIIDSNVALFRLMRSTGSTQDIPILITHSCLAEVPQDILAAKDLIAFDIPASFEESVRAVCRLVPSLPTTEVERGTAQLQNASSDERTLERVRHVCRNFLDIAAPLRRRRTGKVVIELNDEYDVQDVLHVTLRAVCDDVRPEEPGPSFAGSSTRKDFFLPAGKLVVEAKRVRDTQHGRAGVVEEIVTDQAHYSKHQDCERLVCLIYDPDRHIPNVTALTTDLSQMSGKPAIEVYVAR